MSKRTKLLRKENPFKLSSKISVGLNYLEYPLFQIHAAFVFLAMGILFLIYKMLDCKID